MNAKTTNKGPWFHRLLVWLFSAALCGLLFWLIGLVIQDIGRWSGPDRDAFVAERLDSKLTRTIDELNAQIAENDEEAASLKSRTDLLSKSISKSQETIGQLVQLRRLAVEDGTQLSEQEEKSFTKSRDLFLASQKTYQELNDQLVERHREKRELQRKLKVAVHDRDVALVPIHEELGRLYERHKRIVMATKLGALAPLLLIAAWLFLKQRSGTYGPMVYAFGIAVALRVLDVLQDELDKYFNYILAGVCILIAGRILIYLLRMIAFPKMDWLLKQYREAYEAFLCPVCSFPIRRGPLKYMAWTKRSIRKHQLSTTPSADADQPYTCPMCSTQLYETCAACGAVRHSLLPSCAACGAVIEVGGEKPPEQAPAAT